MVEFTDSKLSSLYKELQAKANASSASGPSLLEALEKLYKKFVGVQKNTIHLQDALPFAKLFSPLFTQIMDNDDAACSAFHERLMNLAVNVQEIIWKQYEYEKLKKAGQCELFLPARYVWIELEEFAETRKVVRAIIFTMQYIDGEACCQLVEDFRHFIEDASSMRGFGNILTHEIRMLVRPSYTKVKADIKFANLWTGTVNRESFKELKAMISCIKHHMQYDNGMLLSTKITRAGHMIKLVKKILDTPSNLEKWYMSGELENSISALGQVYQRLHSDMLREKTDEEWNDYFFESVGLEIIGQCREMCNHLNPKGPMMMQNIPYSTIIFVGHRYIELLTHRLAHKMPLAKRQAYAQKAMEHLATIFNSAFEYHKFAERVMKQELTLIDTKGNRSHWGLFLDGIDAVFKSAKMLHISTIPIIECFEINLDDTKRYQDQINDRLLTQMMDQIVKWIAPDVSDLNLFDIFGVISDEHRCHLWLIFVGSLMHIGLAKDKTTLEFIVKTITTSHDLLIDSEEAENIDMDFLALLVLQIEAIDPKIAKPVKALVKERSSSSVIVTIWKHLIPWHQQVSTAWSNGVDNAPAPNLDVRLISGLSVKHEYKNRNLDSISTTHQQLLIQTIAIAGQLLLIIGKRADGRRLLMELVEVVMTWVPEMSCDEIDPNFAEPILEILMEVAQSAWLDYDSSYSERLLQCLNEIQTMMDETGQTFEPISIYLENTKMIEVFANWANPSQLTATYAKLPKSLFSRMQGDASDFYRHSMGQAVTACHSKRQKAPNLRYCVQIHSSLVSTITDRSFFQTLFMTNQPKTGSMTMPNFGHDTLMAFRNIEKIIWYTRTITEEFLARGFTTEVRQFSNELVTTSEIWGLQIPYLIGKSNQIRSLHFEGQKKKWQEEVGKLVHALSDNLNFVRQLEPSALAEAISLEPVRRNSSTAPQEGAEPKVEAKKEPDEFGSEGFEFKLPAITVTNMDKPEVSSPSQFGDKKKKLKFAIDVPSLPKLSKLDVNSASAIVYAFNTLFLVIPDAEKAVQSGLRMFQEVTKAELAPACVYETVSTILARSVEIPSIDYQLEIEHTLQVIGKRNDGFNGREFGRYCLTRVLYMHHVDALNGTNEIEKEVVPAIAKLRVDDGHMFKTPQRPKKKGSTAREPKSSAKPKFNPKTPSRRLVVPKANRLPATPKFEIYKDSKLPMPAINLASGSGSDTSGSSTGLQKPVIKTRTKSRIKRENSEDEWLPSDSKSMKGIRKQRETAAHRTRSKKLNAAGNDEVIEADRGLADGGNDEVFTPGKKIESTRLDGTGISGITSSRPTSPLDNDIANDFPDAVRPIVASPNIKSLLGSALSVANDNGDVETARATMYVRMNAAIKAHRAAHGMSQMITLSKEFAQLHIGAVGIGAIFDTEFSCQSRLCNTISPSEFPENAKKTAKEMLRFIDGQEDATLLAPIVLMTLVPGVTESLRCSYKSCNFVITRIETNGQCLSVVFDGAMVWKRCAEMVGIVEKVASQLGEAGGGDARVWWAHRRDHNEEIVQLVSKTLPDAMDIALPLLALPTTPNMTLFKDTVGVVVPKDPALKAYLGHVVSCWHDLPVRTKQNITAFYTDRTSARLTFQKIINSISTEPNAFQPHTTTYLIPSRMLQQCPIERLKVMAGIRVSRLPSVKHAKYLMLRSLKSKSATSIDVSRLFYLIDNQGNLDVTNKTLNPFFSAPKSWKGFSSTNPKSNEMIQALNNRSLYVFCGHGSGSDAVGGWGRVQRKGMTTHCHLIGCSSGRLRDNGRTEPRGTPLKILDAGAPSVMALLWSITDRDIDRYTLRLYADWFSAKANSKSEPGPNLAQFISSSEVACKLGPLNGGATVNYGLLPSCYNIPENWDKGLPKKINYKDQDTVAATS